jgi:hypothetical protein
MISNYGNQTTHPRINKEDIEEFFKSIKDQIHLVAIDPSSSTVIGHDFGANSEEAIAWAIDHNLRGLNVYWTVNLVRSGLHKKPTKKDIIGIRFTHLDIDPPKSGGRWDSEQALSSLLNSSVPPTFIIWSGNGWQALWRVDGTLEEVERANRGLLAAFRGDPVTWNADRLFRVPGLLNYPSKKKIAAGRTVRLAGIELPDDGQTIKLQRLIDAFPEPLKIQRERGNISVVNVSRLISKDLPLALWPLIDHPIGPDRSKDTYIFACEALRFGLTADQIMGVLLNKANAISAHCLDQADPDRAARRAIEAAMGLEDIARYVRQRDDERTRQLEEDRRIASGEEVAFPTAQLWTLDDMLDRLVFIADGSQVADVENPRCALSMSDFKNLTAASQMMTPTKGRDDSSRMTIVQTSGQWLKHPGRKGVQTITFNPSGGLLTIDPNGQTAINTWNGFRFSTPPEDWAVRVIPFLEHVHWLWGFDVDPFLDWSAHLAQRPGELPSFAWVHIAKSHGMGRNWLAGVLGRVFAGFTALGVDLGGILNSGFNGTIGSKILAIVDEINEGGSGKVYQHAQALKRIITEETRTVNPKFGRQRVEYNSCRWLIFSNSLTALPLEDEDRRFWVARCEDHPRDAEYYSQLYKLRTDPLFIASVAHWLMQRDISQFNPGARPPLTEAKIGLLDRTRSEAEILMRKISELWPVDLITSHELREILDQDMPTGPAMRYALDRAGWQMTRRLQLTSYGSRQNVYAVRNAEIWKSASPEALKAELERATAEEKKALIF